MSLSYTRKFQHFHNLPQKPPPVNVLCVHLSPLLLQYNSSPQNKKVISHYILYTTLITFLFVRGQGFYYSSCEVHWCWIWREINILNFDDQIQGYVHAWKIPEKSHVCKYHCLLFCVGSHWLLFVWGKQSKRRERKIGRGGLIYW